MTQNMQEKSFFLQFNFDFYLITVGPLRFHTSNFKFFIVENITTAKYPQCSSVSYIYLYLMTNNMESFEQILWDGNFNRALSFIFSVQDINSACCYFFH